VTRILGFIITAAGSAVIWAASPALTGRTEPWDAENPYYLAALAALGIAAGAARWRIASDERHVRTARAAVDMWYLVAVFLGAFAGQLVYLVMFVPTGPLLLLGVLFLAAFSLVVVAAAGLVTALRVASARRRVV
jgi:hypothetical protein